MKRNILLVVAAVLLVGAFLAYKVSTNPNFFAPKFAVQQRDETHYRLTIPKSKTFYPTGIWIPAKKTVEIYNPIDTPVQPFRIKLGDEEFGPVLQPRPTYDSMSKFYDEMEVPEEQKKKYLEPLEESKDIKDLGNTFMMRFNTYTNQTIANSDQGVALPSAKMLYIRMDDEAVGDAIELQLTIYNSNSEDVWKVLHKSPAEIEELRRQNREAAKNANVR
ncbi:MAG: hypothetical protein ACLGJB_03620 [Blastocatellia bacterium]